MAPSGPKIGRNLQRSTEICRFRQISANLDRFRWISPDTLRSKSIAQTEFLLGLLDELAGGGPEVITPRNPKQRGGQLSLRFGAEAKVLHEALTRAGVVCDFREPDCLRLAVAPLYNRYEDLVRFDRDFVCNSDLRTVLLIIFG